MMSPYMLTKPKIITVVDNIVYIAIVTSLESLHNYLSTFWLNFWSWSKLFFYKKNNKKQSIQIAWCFIWLNENFVPDKMVIFYFCWYKFPCPHHIWLVSKFLTHNFSDKVHLNPGQINNGVNWFSIDLNDQFCILRTDLDVLIVSITSSGVLYLATAVEF